MSFSGGRVSMKGGDGEGGDVCVNMCHHNMYIYIYIYCICACCWVLCTLAFGNKCPGGLSILCGCWSCDAEHWQILSYAKSAQGVLTATGGSATFCP